MDLSDLSPVLSAAAPLVGAGRVVEQAADRDDRPGTVGTRYAVLRYADAATAGAQA